MFSQRSTTSQGLPIEFSNRPELKQHESEFLINLAKEMCMEVIFYAQENGGSVKWKLKENKKGVQIFQGEEFGGNEDLTYICGVNTIRGTLDEVADLFNISNETKLMNYSKVFEPDLIDMVSLYDLATSTPENPMHYIGVRWSAVESTNPLVKNRDFCYLECQDEFVDTRTNKQGWVRCMHSINIPCCSTLEKKHGFVRGSYYRSGIVVVETERPGFLDITHILQVNFKGTIPAWIRRQMLQRRVAGLSRIEKFFQMRELSAGPILGDIDLPPKKHVPNCYYCSRKFDPIFTRKFRCRKCGEVVCKHCSEHWYLNLPVSGEKRVRICTKCSAQCRDGPLSPGSSRSSSASDDVYAPPLRQYSARIDRPRPSSGLRESTSFRHTNAPAPSIYQPPPNAGMSASFRQTEEPLFARNFSRVSIEERNDHFMNTSASRANNYEFDNMSDVESSMYETNPFDLKPPPREPKRTIDHVVRQLPTRPSTNPRQNEQEVMPQLEPRMRARDPTELNTSFVESVRSIQLGSGWSSDGRTDLFNAENFGESEVNLDTLDREWSRHFAANKSYMASPGPMQVPGNTNSSFGSASVVSHHSSLRYSVQIPH